MHISRSLTSDLRNCSSMEASRKDLITWTRFCWVANHRDCGKSWKTVTRLMLMMRACDGTNQSSHALLSLIGTEFLVKGKACKKRRARES